MVENKSQFSESSDPWSEIQGDQVVDSLKQGKTVKEINSEFAKLTGLEKSSPKKREPSTSVKKRRPYSIKAVDDLMSLRMGSQWGRNTRG